MPRKGKDGRRPQMAADDRENRPQGHGSKSAATREQAVLSLLEERTIAQAAKRCGVGVRTLGRWLTDDDDFKAMLEAARAAAYLAGIGRVQTLTARAVSTLEDLLEVTESPAVRLGAARTALELAVHQRDAATILRKLDELEAAQQQRRR